MTTSIRLDGDFVAHARVYAEAESRSVPEQIEYWAQIGKMMIENPDLSYQFAHESLLATEEMNRGFIKQYARRTHRS